MTKALAVFVPRFRLWLVLLSGCLWLSPGFVW